MAKRVTSIGGQALLEGILMVGPKKNVAAFCDEAGNITTEEVSTPSLREKYPILKKPFIRGVFSMVDTLRLGMKALTLSADKVGGEEEEEPSKFEKWLPKKNGDKGMKGFHSVGGVLGVALAVLLFFFLPAVLFNGLMMLTGDGISGWRSVFEGLLRIVIFVLYIVVISKMPEIDRTFRYHGAEHKTIFCYEHGLPLTVENVRKQPRHHPRCGTSFLFMVIAISILVSTVVFGIWPVHNALWRFVAHLLMLPIIVGVSYEFNRWAGRHDGPVTKLLTAPGLWLQNFTTFEPDDSMIECAIRSLELVLPSEKGKDEW